MSEVTTAAIKWDGVSDVAEVVNITIKGTQEEVQPILTIVRETYKIPDWVEVAYLES